MATLSAEWFIVAASALPSPDTSSSRAVSAGRLAEEANAIRSSVRAAGTTACAVIVKASWMTSVAAGARTSVLRTDQSASRPPSSVPRVIPTPNSASAIGTPASAKPDTSVSVGAT